jgi:hypothetical protein
LGKDYNTFKTANTAIDNEMRVLYSTPSAADNFLPAIVKSGSSNPAKVTVNQGDKFYKIVPKGIDINGPSPYYLSEAEYQWIKANPSQLEQKLGLPLSSVGAEYDVFKIVPKGNNIGSPSVYYVDQTQLNLIKVNPEKLEQVLGLPLGIVNAEYDVFKITFQGNSGYVFKSTVAGTEQFANSTPMLKYLTPGGGTQSLILDNMDGARWLKGSTPIESIKPNILPLIVN